MIGYQGITEAEDGVLLMTLSCFFHSSDDLEKAVMLINNVLPVWFEHLMPERL